VTTPQDTPDTAPDTTAEVPGAPSGPEVPGAPARPASVRPVDYKGDLLDAERGPGLGCFWAQLVLLVTFLVLTPLTVAWNMPPWVSIVLLFITLILLLFSGQTVIFLLRLVASDRREGRRVPLAGSTPTVGEIEDTLPAADEDVGAAADGHEPDGVRE
jgi:hypothetical protein